MSYLLLHAQVIYWRETLVLVGLDRSFDYQKMTNAADAIREGTLFVTINRDPVLPVSGGFLPSCGSLAAALETASGVSPEVVGKPEPMLLLEAMKMLGSEPEETVMVGDGQAIDILAGQRAGTHTLLVLSGSTSREDLEQSSLKPDHVYLDLADVMKSLVYILSMESSPASSVSAAFYCSGQIL